MDIAKITAGAVAARTGLTMAEEAAVRQPGAVPPARPEPVDPTEAAGKEDERAVVDRIESMRAQISANSRSRLTIEREGDKGRFIYKMLDPQTGETVRQWPPERYLELVAYLRDQQGGLVNQRA